MTRKTLSPRSRLSGLLRFRILCLFCESDCRAAQEHEKAYFKGYFCEEIKQLGYNRNKTDKIHAFVSLHSTRRLSVNKYKDNCR